MICLVSDVLHSKLIHKEALNGNVAYSCCESDQTVERGRQTNFEKKVTSDTGTHTIL